ncbi:MAG: hypothetical protein KDC87_16390 [Planctomycetes bacterium]|nr:hypothetical protein [Planctomycetota bacterium]MCB9869522.1 hypothetical protein [Planctomycetota bacterium]
MRHAKLHSCALLLSIATTGMAQGLAIDWRTVASGGGQSTGSGFELSGTIGQGHATAMGAGGFRIDGGFWAAALPQSSNGTITGFTSIPGPSRVLLKWTSGGATGLSGFQVSRREADFADQPFTPVREVTYSGPGQYELLDDLAAPSTRYVYLLAERFGPLPAVPRALLEASCYGASLPANTSRVGPNGNFADIASALRAASGPACLIMVQPGTYPAFSVDGSSPDTLRIVADGTGRVHIDTKQGPISLQGRKAGQVVELRGLSVGQPTTAHPALRIAGSRGVVIVDSCTLTGGAAQPGVLLDDATSVALQGCSASGAPGVQLDGGSQAIASRGSVDALTVTGNSNLTLCQLVPGTRKVDPGSTLDELSGVMPDLQGNALQSLLSPLDLTIETFPNGLIVLAVATDNDWTRIPGFEMVQLLPPGSLVQIGRHVADAQGAARLSFALPNTFALLGMPFPTQFAGVNPATAAVRLSNTQAFTILR